MSQLGLKQVETRRGWLAEGWAQMAAVHRPLAWMTAAMSVIAVLGLVGTAVDPRVIVGQPAWAKTTKFAMSMAIYGGTLLWLFAYVPRRTRFLQLFLTATAGILSFEMLLLMTQAVRGRAMHFNYGTPLDGVLYTAMAASIYVLFALTLVAAVVVWRQPLADRVFAWSLRLGLAITVVVGFGVANLMVRPTAVQLAEMQAGAPTAGDVIGAHTVGAEDGGPGLPLLGWSTEHGDLRIAHFFGLHALQVVPLVGWLLARRREAWLRQRDRLALLGVAAAAYVGWVALVTWQALRGQAFIAPDGLTLLALAGLVGTAVVAAAGIVWAADRQRMGSG